MLILIQWHILSPNDSLKSLVFATSTESKSCSFHDENNMTTSGWFKNHSSKLQLTSAISNTRCLNLSLPQTFYLVSTAFTITSIINPSNLLTSRFSAFSQSRTFSQKYRLNIWASEIWFCFQVEFYYLSQNLWWSCY